MAISAIAAIAVIAAIAAVAIVLPACGAAPAAAEGAAPPPEQDEAAPRQGGAGKTATASPEGSEVSVAPVASGEVRGKVSAAGSLGENRADGLVVVLRARADMPDLSSEVDDDGGFFFGPIPPGRYELSVVREYESLADERVVDVQNEETAEVVVDISRARE